MRKLLFIILMAAMSLVCCARTAPKCEFRGAWLHIVGDTRMKDMSDSQIRERLSTTLDRLQEAGCNAVFFQVRPQADAFYKSEIEPWTRFLTGEQGKAPKEDWDPLKFMIEQCHSRGMELHAWLNPYRVTSNASEKLCEGHIYWQKPEIFKKYGSQIYFDPGEPESREQLLKVIGDIVTRYDVDGIHFDDYFYPYPVDGKDFPDNDSFSKYGSSQGFEKNEKADWRRHNTSLLIHETNALIKSIKPWVRFGVSPFGIYRNSTEWPQGSRTNGLSCYNDLYADPLQWDADGDVDYLAPQLYWKIGHRLADYETLINWWSGIGLKGQLYIGQSIETLSEPDTVNPGTTQLARKMQLTMELPCVDGNVWWPGWDLAEGRLGIADSLSRSYQSVPALLPAYTGIDDIPPPPVKEFRARRGRGLLRWSTEANDDPMQAAACFVVYRFRPEEEVDISDPTRIFAITRDNWIAVESDGESRHQYVVTALDACWNESEASEPVLF